MSNIFSRLACAAAIVLALVPMLRAQPAEPGFKSLFNGKDLTGWAGRPNHWSVEDGAITGTTTADNPAKGNNFLIAKDGDKNLIVGDFELRFSYKFTGPFGNSGLQYRSADKGNFVVNGYQGDFEVGTTYSGILYEEGGRGILAERGQKVVIKPDPADANKPKIEVVGSVGETRAIQARIQTNGWNDYVIIAQGNHLQHFINGQQTVDVVDEHTARAAKSGILALQIHQGPPMEIQFKNIRIKTTAGRSDADLMQGDWTPVEYVSSGDKTSAGELAGFVLNIKGNRFTADTDRGSMTGTLELNEKTSPRSLEVTTASGDYAAGIYEISGDSFRACYSVTGGDRPKEFKSEGGSGVVLVTYKRKGAKKDIDLMQGNWLPTEFISSGDKVSASDLAALLLTIKGNTYAADTDQGSQSGKFELNERTSPKSLDATTSGGDTAFAIYEVSADTFRVCYSTTGGDRPKEFKSEGGSGIVLATYKRKQRADIDLLQGDWIAAEVTANGEKVAASELTGMTLSIRGANYAIQTQNGPQSGKLELNATTAPKSMDVITDGGITVPAIYEISADTFRFCYSNGGDARPAEFKSSDGSNILLATYRRKP